MNRRERAVLLLLTAAFVVGIGISYWKRSALTRQAAASPITVTQDASAPRAPDSVARGRPLDINRATAGELDALPGIGPVLAARIVEYRQRRGGFRSVTELRAVSGIGEKRYSALKDMVVLGSAAAAPAESGR